MYELTCRKNARGRGLDPVVPIRGTLDPAKSRLGRWTIFVHGFNNSLRKADATWARTTRALASRGVRMGEVVLFYWPGDYSRFELLSAMNYPRTVPIAEDTAARLVEYLQRATQGREPRLELSFVAHSLGCLVVLETLRRLRLARAHVAVRDVLLMAAAVPEGFCWPLENYGIRFSDGTRETVLFSHKDRVLQFCFRPGQRVARRFPAERRDAVGRTGGPGGGLDRRWSANEHMYGLGHGDYWWHSPRSVAEIAAVVKPETTPRRHALPDASGSLPLADTLPVATLDHEDEVPLDDASGWGERVVGV